MSTGGGDDGEKKWWLKATVERERREMIGCRKNEQGRLVFGQL
jgi:hypothetical protein